MAKWQIEYWTTSTRKSPIEKWLDKLTEEQLIAVARQLTVLQELGNELRMPQSKALGGSLFELRERRYGYRIYYSFLGGAVIILLATGDKKTQERDIKVARQRLAKN